MKRLLRKLKRARELSIHDWSSFVQSWLLLLFADIYLRIGSFQRLQEMLRGWSSFPRQSSTNLPDQPASEEEIKKLAWIVEAAGRNHIIRMSCLRRALVQQWLLHQHQIQTELRFGVRTAEGSLQAHAWLEKDGKLISEPEIIRERYTTLVEIGQVNLKENKPSI